MTREVNCFNGSVVIVSVAVSALIGLICFTAGYIANKNYNGGYRSTNCTYIGYDFRPFPWNNWDCKECTGYYASITTATTDGKIWYTHNDTVYPPGNSVDRQTNWYRQHWPIGQTVLCYQTECCSNPPIIFQLADTFQVFWAAVVFLSLAFIMSFVSLFWSFFGKDHHKCRRRKVTCCSRSDYTDIDESDVGI